MVIAPARHQKHHVTTVHHLNINTNPGNDGTGHQLRLRPADKGGKLLPDWPRHCVALRSGHHEYEFVECRRQLSETPKSR
jgi:hypothetical protein